MRLWDVKCMTWAEFQIKSFGYWRSNKKDQLNTKFIAYHSLIGPHVDPKTLPKTFAQFTGEKKKVKISDKAKQFYLTEMQKFKDQQKYGREATG